MKDKFNRRKFISVLASSFVLLSLSNLITLKRLNAKSKPKLLIIGTGIGKSKKKAEQYACKDCLIKLNIIKN